MPGPSDEVKQLWRDLVLSGRSDEAADELCLAWWYRFHVDSVMPEWLRIAEDNADMVEACRQSAVRGLDIQ